MLLALLSLLLPGCTPIASMPPPTPLAEGARTDLGMAVNAGWQDTNISGCGDNLFVFLPCAGAGVSGWYTIEPAPSLSFSVLGYAGIQEFAGGGFMLRLRPVHTRRFSLGLQLDGGWLWGSVGVPIAVGIDDHTWVYTNPSVGPRALTPVRIPVGVSIEGRRGHATHFEFGAGGGAFDDNRQYVLQDVRPWLYYAAVGVSFRSSNRAKP